MKLFSHEEGLFSAHTGVGKHSDLSDHVIPVPGSFKFDKCVIETLSHGHDTSNHGLQVGDPFREQAWVVQDSADDAGTERWWIRDG